MDPCRSGPRSLRSSRRSRMCNSRLPPTITPHGDRKLRRLPGLACRDGPLITPQGDRKQPTAVVASSSMSHSTSLPLMGIGNIRRPAGHSGRWSHRGQLITPHGDRKPCRRTVRRGLPAASHYPSWGSETAGSAVGGAGAAAAHYPSWGSETMYGRSSTHGTTPSLPLIGIGNCGSARRTGRPRSPHYPSWGSETPAPLPFTHRSAVSLPLMWIGNYARPCHHHECDRRALITPHGDRKPAVAPLHRLRCRSGTHYPSWGSETCHHTLMRQSCSPRVTISLPLMGIGNCCTRSSMLLPLRLITPHGDRKPPAGADRLSAPVHQAHYPSWGSETPSDQCSCAPCVSVYSLPLMGIGT